MAIDISFYSFLQSQTVLPVAQDVISEDVTTARVWFGRSQSNTQLLNNGQPMLYDTVFSVEVMSTNIDQMQTEANNLRTALDGYRGSMGMDTVLGVFVTDASDDYVPKNLNADEGWHVQAFSARILY